MKRRLLFLTATLLLISLFSATAYGAEAAVFLECPEQAAPDTSFSAALLYEGDTFLSASVDVDYDPEILEFRSCSGGEGFAEDGKVRITLDGGSGKVYLSCKIRFKALKEGESFITVTTSRLLNTAEEELIAETCSAKVVITQDAAEGTEEADSEADADSTGSHEEEETGEEIYILRVMKEGLKRTADGFRQLICQFTVTEFLFFGLCVTMILLLAVLLAAEKGKGK